MFTRISSSLALIALLAACSGSPDGPETEGQVAARAGEDNVIACALSGAKELAKLCSVERAKGPDGLVLTIRHNDGGFRRLLVTTDGRGVVTADGAEPAVIQSLGENSVEVMVGDDRYRLPATIKAKGGIPDAK
jgi:hypothetical protein